MKEHCRHTLERAYLILDGESITAEERRQIEGHLHDCGPCFERYGIEIEVKKVIARLQGSTHCPAELKNRIMDILKEA
jgi:mycothiol system anti-sigma-R factor